MKFSATPFFFFPALRAVLVTAFLTALLTGCAGTAPRPAPASAPALPGLETVRPALRTTEDSLVLDVLLGYRELAAGGSDREALKRARSAQNELDYMLRHGGVKEHGGEGRVLEPAPGEKATLAELTAQMSRALLRVPAGEAEANRAREIQRHRLELSFLAEDAEWVLTLSAALDGPLPDEDKKNLRRLHEDYANRAAHTVIAGEVTALLKTVQDERLRKELKQLANRSWERERRAKAEAASPAPALPAVELSRPPAPAHGTPAPAPSAPAPLLDFDPPLPDTAAADTLTSPDRFCDERRAEAAQSFAGARAATGEARAALLRQSLASLDACLKRYPDSKGAEKARGNRDRVEKELRNK